MPFWALPGWWWWRRWVLGAGLTVLALIVVSIVHAANVNRPYAAHFKAAWNHVDPHAPIISIACLDVSAKETGKRALEDCLIVERTPQRGKPHAMTCTGAYLDPRYSNPLSAVEYATLEPCTVARKMIAQVKHAGLTA